LRLLCFRRNEFFKSNLIGTPIANVYDKDIQRNGKERLAVDQEGQFKKKCTFTPRLNNNSRKIIDKKSNLVFFLHI
jgi:hypothetical protein